MTDTTIILLDGATSAGKAAIAQMLQDRLDLPYCYFSVDDFLHMLPGRYMSGEGEDLTASLEAQMERLFPRLISAAHHCIRSLADQNINLIVDHVIQRREWLDECVSLLENHAVLYVAVCCRLGELERRERDAGRVEGLARAQLRSVHSYGDFDLEVDTCLSTPEQCTERILDKLGSDPGTWVFHQLRASRSRV